MIALVQTETNQPLKIQPSGQRQSWARNRIRVGQRRRYKAVKISLSGETGGGMRYLVEIIPRNAAPSTSSTLPQRHQASVSL
jgi:hypothetical protein